MKRFAFLIVALLVGSIVLGDINIASKFRWGVAAGAASYKLRVLDSLNNPITISDPATDDPDGDGFIDVPASDPDGDGFQEIEVSKWLVGKPLGLYKFKVKPLDINGNAGTEVGLNDTYVSPSIDPTTLSFVP